MALLKFGDSSHAVSKAADWPDLGAIDSRGARLFDARPAYRRLTVVADAELVDAVDSDPWSPKYLLNGLLTHNFVTLYRYADDGPPRNVPWHVFPNGAKHPLGWVLADVQMAHQVRNIQYTNSPHSFTYTGITGNRVEAAERDVSSTAYRSLPSDEARRRREADAIAVLAAECVQADLFITERPYLFENSVSKQHGVTVCSLADALALVGLYLRAQSQYVLIQSPSGTFPLVGSKLGYFWVGARELLPEVWRWGAAFGQIKNDELQGLALSAIERIRRALIKRDELNISLQSYRGNNAVSEVITALDELLVGCMGAIDVTARVAHDVLGVSGRSSNAGWQRSGWLRDVARANQSVAALVQPGGHQAHVLKILTAMRNTVHAEVLQGAMHQSGDGSQEPLVRLPPGEAQDIVTAMDATGGPAHWGVKQEIQYASYVDPQRFVEAALPAVIALLNLIMKTVPVEAMPGVHLAPQDCLPPAGDSWQNSFAEQKRQSIRWQLGL